MYNFKKGETRRKVRKSRKEFLEAVIWNPQVYPSDLAPNKLDIWPPKDLVRRFLTTWPPFCRRDLLKVEDSFSLKELCVTLLLRWIVTWYVQ